MKAGLNRLDEKKILDFIRWERKEKQCAAAAKEDVDVHMDGTDGGKDTEDTKEGRDHEGDILEDHMSDEDDSGGEVMRMLIMKIIRHNQK